MAVTPCAPNSLENVRVCTLLVRSEWVLPFANWPFVATAMP